MKSWLWVTLPRTGTHARESVKPWNKNALNSRRIWMISKRKIVVLRFFKRRRRTTALGSPSTLVAQNIELESSLEVERKHHPESTIVVMEANCRV